MKPVKNILVLTYWSFNDALVQTYTLPYLKMMLQALPAGSRIYLVTLEKQGLQQNEVAGFPNIINLPFNYLPFGISASVDWLKNIVQLRRCIKKYNISYIHAFCTPAGMIGYLLSRLSRKPLVIDSYEPHAEAMVENGEWQKNSWSYKILFYFERQQTRRARHIIAATAGMAGYAKQKYGVNIKNMFVKPACVDLDLFTPAQRKDAALLAELGLQGKTVGVYAGKFGGIYLKEEVFAFYKACYELWKDDFVALILTSHAPAEIEVLAQQAGLPKHLFRVLFVPHAQIAGYIGLGDFAITPVKPVPTKQYCTPIKDGEYWAMGLPVVITKNISIDSELIQQNNAGHVLQSLTPAEYNKAAEHINTLLREKDLLQRIRAMAERERNFGLAQHIYKAIYASS